MPTSTASVMIRSAGPFCPTAASTPNSTPKTLAKASAVPARSNVGKRRAAISSITGLCRM